MFNDVKKFMIACDQSVDKMNHEQSDLYENLIDEEYNEFLHGLLTSKEETLDACCDMIWVIIGYCYSRGWNIEDAFAEVARSNMSKIDPATGKAIKREDGKVLKPTTYFKPNLKSFV